MAILQKIAAIRAGLSIEKTGYDERQDYYYFKAEDVAKGVRSAMVEHGVIHRTEVLEWNEDNFWDQNGRNRPRHTVKAKVVFIDSEDGSEFATEVIATGSDTGGDKGPRKAAVMCFKIAAIDVFTIVEDMGAYDSDGQPEMEPISNEPAKSNQLTATDLSNAIADMVNDPQLDHITGQVVTSVGNRVAIELLGQETKAAVWKKSKDVLEKVLSELENGVVE